MSSRTGAAAAQLVAPPQNLEAEQSVLGTVLLSDTAMPALVDEEQLQADDFYREGHGRIWQAMVDLHRRHEPVDHLTLLAELERRGVLEQIGGAAAVHMLAGSVPAVGNVRQYARIVRECALLRRLLRATYETQTAVHERTAPAGELVERLADTIRDLDRGAAVAGESYDQPTRFLEWYDAERRGLPLTSFPEITEAIGGGLQPGEGTMLGGWPGMGKTLLGKDIMLEAASAGARCHDFANEQFGPRRTARLISTLTGISARRIRRRELTQGDWRAVLRVLGDLEQGKPYRTTPTPAWRAEDYCRAMRRGRYDVAVIDTVTNLPCGKVEEWDRACAMLFDTAAQIGTHLILLCQLHRGRDDAIVKKPPVGGDLRNTGAWYQRAKVVLFVHCDQELVEGVPKSLPEGHIRVDKANDGDQPELGFVQVYRNPRTASFERLQPTFAAEPEAAAVV